MTDEELMSSPSVKDFFENGDAVKMLEIIEKNNRRANGHHHSSDDQKNNGKGS